MGKLSSQARAEDVDQRRLAEELRGATMDCVNAVGVDLNTASPAILERLRSVWAVLGLELWVPGFAFRYRFVVQDKG